MSSITPTQCITSWVLSQADYEKALLQFVGIDRTALPSSTTVTVEPCAVYGLRAGFTINLKESPAHNRERLRLAMIADERDRTTQVRAENWNDVRGEVMALLNELSTLQCDQPETLEKLRRKAVHFHGRFS